MTPPSVHEPTETLGPATSTQRAYKARISAYESLNALAIALQATKLAIAAANEAPIRSQLEQRTPTEMFETWQATCLLTHQVFENLYQEANYSISAVRVALNPD